MVSVPFAEYGTSHVDPPVEFDTSANESSLGDVVCKDIVVVAPPTNDQTPDLTSVIQLSSSAGVANIQLVWTPPSRSTASAGSAVVLYSIYHGNQSQLFKIKEVSEAATSTGASREYVIGGIGGEQACFALTARYDDGLETVLGEIVCVALVHSAAPQGSCLRSGQYPGIRSCGYDQACSLYTRVLGNILRYLYQIESDTTKAAFLLRFLHHFYSAELC